MTFRNKIYLVIGTGFFVIVVGILIFPRLAFADGMVVVRPDPNSDRWDYLTESNQGAFINYENGSEKMILTIGAKEAAKNAVWIFPVPSDPTKVKIDVLTKLPQFSGEEISKGAKSNLSDIKETLWNMQIYPLFFGLGADLMPATSTKPGAFSLDIGSSTGITQDVIVYERLEKEGVTTEIITAKTAQGLYEYLQGKNLKIEGGSIPVLDNYIGQEYTFVVSWISSFEGTSVSQTEQKGVYVAFPTKKIYYPLLPTSVYGSKVVPATIRVLGYVTPEVFGDIKNDTKTEYYLQNSFSIAPELKNFYGDLHSPVKYTKIGINAPSKMLTEDLWIKKTMPFKIIHTSFIAQHPLSAGIFLLILSSIIAGLASALIVFKEARNWRGALKFGLVGLSNCFSIIGFLITIIFIKTKQFEEDQQLFQELKGRGYSTWIFQIKDVRKLAFIPLFSVSFLIISWVIIKLIELSL